MSGVHRFLSRREKRPKTSASDRPESQHDSFLSVFALESDKKPDREEDKRITAILERLRHYGIETMGESNVRYALRATFPQGDGEKAFRLLMLLQETYEGEIKAYNPNVQLLGAVNREATTCFLDALLFSMFARLDSFEAMLYDTSSDAARKRLAGVLRLWVNMLRTGRLITVDITQNLQDALAQCGWADAARIRQQDPSEAFTFMTNKLQVPLLTLKMDLFHTGKEDQDDHKFVNERLLEVAILDQPPEGSDVITLEDCLEHYFNNRIEVKRFMENQRRNTLKMSSLASPVDAKVEKESGMHVEVAEVSSSPATPLVQTPSAEGLSATYPSRDPMERLRPGLGRKRADSIFSQRKIEVVGVEPDGTRDDDSNSQRQLNTERKMSTKTEVLMPAWQFFKLLPWYTDHLPETDAQVAAHFSKKRPVLGICLKRYSYSNAGQAQRRDTHVDIPLEIVVPNFVSDEEMDGTAPLGGNFTLLLQSVVCHRGVSVHSGHYISLCRGKASNAGPKAQEQESRRSSDSGDGEDPWMRFDDLARQRVSYVDIRTALKEETPYLLFYQVQPIAGEEHSLNHELPSYAEATSRSQSDAARPEKFYFNEQPGSENALAVMDSQPSPAEGARISDTIDRVPVSSRTSMDAITTFEGPRGRSSFQSEKRPPGSVTEVADNPSAGSIRTADPASIPTTPGDEKDSTAIANGLLAVAGAKAVSRGSLGRRSKSRPTSSGPDSAANRFGMSMTKLTQKLSRNESAGATHNVSQSPQVLSTENSVENQHISARVVDSADKGPTAIVTALPLASEPVRQHHSEAPPPASKVPSAYKGKNVKLSGKHKHRDDDRDCIVM